MYKFYTFLLAAALVSTCRGDFLRDSLQGSGSQLSWSPPNAKMVINANSPGASITADQGTCSKTVGSTLCSYSGSNSSTATTDGQKICRDCWD